MKKKSIFLIFILFFYVINAETKELSLFTIGNLNGNYKDLPNIAGFINYYKNLDKNLIIISTGNNVLGDETVDSLYDVFYKHINCDFNFIGNGEYIFKSYKKTFYSSLNILETDNRYSIINKNDCKIGIVGITNVYSENNKILDYEKEIKKLLYKIEDECDIIIVISELKRSENIELIKNYKQIGIILETGFSRIDDSYLKIEEQYIVPTNSLNLVKLKYNWKNVSKKIKEKYNTKTVEIISVDKIKNLSEYESDKKIIKEVKGVENKLKIKENEVIGYNDFTISKENIMVGNYTTFIEDIAKQIKLYYNADIIIIPSSTIKDKLEKGYITLKDVKNFLKNERIIVFGLKKEEFDSLYEKNKNNKGTDKYLNFFISEDLKLKKEYKIVSVESLFENYKILTLYKEIKNVGIAFFIERDIK